MDDRNPKRWLRLVRVQRYRIALPATRKASERRKAEAENRERREKPPSLTRLLCDSIALSPLK